MVEIIWTRKAVKDLKENHHYISSDSVLYANHWVNKVLSSIEVLHEFPLSGRVVPEKEDASIREIILGNYRIFYKVSKQNSIVHILRIHHAMKQIK